MNNKIRNITLAGLLTALNILLLYISNLFSLELFILLFLPVIVSFFYLKVDLVTALEYFLANIIILTIINFVLSLSYFIPALIIGFSLGILSKRKINAYYILAILVFVSTLLWILNNYIILFLTEINLITLLSETLGDRSIVYLIYLLIGVTHSIITFFIAQSEYKKFSYQIEFKSISIIYLIFILLLLVVTTVSYFQFKELFSLLLIYSLLLFIPYIRENVINKIYRQKEYIFLALMIIPSFIILILIGQKIELFPLILLPFLIINLIYYEINMYSRRKNTEI